MKHIRLTTLVTVLALLAAGGYLTYQIAVNLTQKVQTVDAIEVTVEDKISARGFFVREQTVIRGSGGNTEYLVEDGEKVAKGEKLAVVFGSESQRQAYDEAQALQQRLSALEYAYSMVTSGVDSVKMDQLISDSIARITRQLDTGEAFRVPEEYSAMQQLVLSRGATEQDKENFEKKITEIRGELSALKRKFSGGKSLKTPVSGYFSGSPDGYETVLTPELLETVTPEQLKSIVPGEAEGVAAVTAGFHWYYAVVLPESDAELLRQRKTLEVYFPEITGSLLEMEVERLESYPDGQAVLILRSDRMEKEYLAAREQDIDIVVGRYSGLKVPARALRQENGRWGVFTLENGTAKFKPISWVYSTDSYYLVPGAPAPKEGLYRFDRIIVRGSNLQDQMLIS